MTVTEGCPICTNIERSCHCRAAFVSYFDLLIKVDRRVSNRKDTSSVVVTVDKVELFLESEITREDLMRRVRVSPYKADLTRLRDRKWYLSLGNGTYFLLGHRDNQVIRKLIANPSRHGCFEDCLGELRHIFSEDEIELMNLGRLDLAIDQFETLEHVLKGLDVKWKRKRYEFLEEGSKRTGLRVGTGQEVLNIYDKSEKYGRAATRIEAQLKGKKLPTKKLLELPEAISVYQEKTPFDCLSLSDIEPVARGHLKPNKSNGKTS